MYSNMEDLVYEWEYIEELTIIKENMLLLGSGWKI